MADLTVDELQVALTAANEKIEKVSSEAASYRKSKGELKTELEKFAGIDVDKYKANMDAATKAEQNRLKQEGEFEKALESGLAASKAEIETLKGLIAGKDGKLSKVLIDNAVLSAIDGKAVNNEHVLSLIRGSIKMDGDNAVVMNGEAPRVNDKGEHVTVADYAVTFLAENPHLAQASGSGSGSQGNQGKQNEREGEKSSVDKIAEGLEELNK
ncbi:hypothetical protein KAR91_52745 [Candidatus Pacearchaeota archaeon]|nr:hypothetical protein [Candidatus Pacearchaeota archaeon]